MQREETYIPKNWEPQPGVVYTAPEDREAIVLYRSVMKTIHMADTREEGSEILRDLAEVAFGFQRLEDVKHRMTISSMLVNVDAASRRYDEAVANGKRGGRPKLQFDRAELEHLREQLGSWEKVAETIGVGARTLYNVRKTWTEDRQIGKNLTDTSTNTSTNTNTFTRTKTSRAPDPEAEQRAREAEFERKRREAMRLFEQYGLTQKDPPRA